jgi:hypothetical protein
MKLAVAKAESSTKRPTRGQLEALRMENFDLRLRLWSARMRPLKVPDHIKVRLLKNLKSARSRGYKPTIAAEDIRRLLAEDIRRLSKRRRRPPLGEKDHRRLLGVISRLPSKDRRNKWAIATALFETEEYKHLVNQKWRYARVSQALKFAASPEFAQSHPKLKSAVEDILSKLPRKLPGKLRP